MAYATNSIMARIVWCRRKGARAHGQRESEEWHAEEAGLRDALLSQDHSNRYRSGLPGLFERYAIGFQDGCALRRIGAMGGSSDYPVKGTKVRRVTTGVTICPRGATRRAMLASKT